jgi:hypothetical protein
MGRFMSALLGIIAGFVLAHVINTTPEGRRVFEGVRATLSSFVNGFKETYRG